MRFNAPIFTYKDILNQAGIHLQTTPSSSDESHQQDGAIARLMDQEAENERKAENYTKHTLKELKALLSEAITHEDYEAAARLRDELSKRNK